MISSLQNRSYAYSLSRIVVSSVCVLVAQQGQADGPVVDKVYHPYVDALETELEYRFIIEDEQPGLANRAQIHQLAIGKSLSDNWFGELYLIGAKDRSGAYEVEAYEAELKWQLTEQGEYSADWGMLFEYEKEVTADIQELSALLLTEKEFGNWSGSANLGIIYEWGNDIRKEFETSLALQARYRYSRSLEPTLEFYAGQRGRGLGPVLQGLIDMGARKNLHWETGVIFGLGNNSPDETWRFMLEYEF